MKLVHWLAHFILLFGLCAGSISAQDMRDHWIVGLGSYVRFESGGPVYVGQVPMETSEGTSSISDTFGQLQAYAYPGAVFNAAFDTMQNGRLTYACLGPLGSSTITQGSLLLPSSNQDDEDRLILLSINSDSTGICGRRFLYRRIIDMQENGGLGGIVEDETQVVASFISEQLTAVRHGNGKDWWIIVRNALPSFYSTSNEFIVLLMHSDTIVKTQYFSTIVSSKAGELVASPDGTKLAQANAFNLGDSTSQALMLYDFDRCEGVISNEHIVDVNRNTYGAAFSSNSEKLYLGTLDGTTEYCAIVQFDLSDTAYPYQLVYLDTEVRHCPGLFELGPDGKVYFTMPFCLGSTPDSLSTYLHAIEFPDSVGPACEVNLYKLALNSGIICSANLPNHPNYYLGADPNNCGDTTTALETLTVDVGWKLYPTVAQKAFVLELPVGVQAEAFILDAVGRVVKQAALKPGKTRIDVSSWPSGMYRVALRQDGRYLGAKTVVRP